ncbi:MAG: hypothetical protein KDD53_10145, partial [Bdellovibrionales bacterium]|nr:hypothetical protein [Bdellovibrionales bacterium]
VKAIVGVMLLLSAAARLNQSVVDHVNTCLTKFKHPYFLLMGIIHGLSNLGGALLTIWANSAFDSKEAVRAHISFAYVFFAIIQIITIFVLVTPKLSVLHIIYPVVAYASFLLVGQRVFDKTSDLVFQNLMTILMAVFGVFVLMKQ